MITDYYFTGCCFYLRIFMFCLFHCIHFHFCFDCSGQLWNWIGYCYKIVGIRSSAIASCFRPLVGCFQLCYCPIKMMPICKHHFRSALRQLSFAYSLMHFYFAEIHNYPFEIYLHYLQFILHLAFDCFDHFISLLVKIFACLDFDLKLIMVIEIVDLPLLWDWDCFWLFLPLKNFF